MSTILFELGCEELPPKSLKPLRDALQASITEQLAEADISFESIKAFAAPRRLAIQIQGIADKQPDRIEQKRGPAIKAAFDADGNPTRAAMGFAKGLVSKQVSLRPLTPIKVIMSATSKPFMVKRQLSCYLLFFKPRLMIYRLPSVCAQGRAAMNSCVQYSGRY